MATTYYMSITSDVRNMADVSHSGTSATSSDVVELRVGNGTYAPSKEEALLALKIFERWLVQAGTNSAGTNIPLPARNAG